ncbi:hypothetical protein [Corynebacterium alimapuense]|uniref:Uncharacterized protein n=1 Tax=Corynebacterium alimapuense TaxID=1576874 RepID=A0A3M8K698_9CORY|nr:hypothetical protein [Corynebacterium alimapuense]RNE48102.1 hypothetical protein C5L39_09485 [Corynebacterium alimapuense]
MHPNCILYTPGHHVHWLQANATYKYSRWIKQVEIVAAEPHWLTVLIDEKIQRGWVHDDDHLQRFYRMWRQATAFNSIPEPANPELFLAIEDPHERFRYLQAPTTIGRVLQHSNGALSLSHPGALSYLYPNWDGPDPCLTKEQAATKQQNEAAES